MYRCRDFGQNRNSQRCNYGVFSAACKTDPNTSLTLCVEQKSAIDSIGASFLRCSWQNSCALSERAIKHS